MPGARSPFGTRAPGLPVALPGSAQFSGSNALTLADTHSPFRWDGVSSFCVAGWFKVATLPTATQIMNIWSQSSDPSVFAGWALQLNGSTGFLNWSVAQNIASGNQRATAVPGITIVQNRWYTCQTALFTPNAGNPVIAIEVADPLGTDIFTTVGWLTPGPGSVQPMALGSGPGGTFGGLTNVNLIGNIDNVGAWNRAALTGAEWALFKNNNSQNTPQGIDWIAASATTMSDAVGWWNLDRSPGTVILQDATGHGRTLVNSGQVIPGPERTK